MKKALKISAAAVALATVCTAGAIFSIERTKEENFALTPCVQTAVLKQGATGGEVKELQRRLKQWGYYNGAVDGIYGKQTVEAVKYFQRKNGLTPDGIAGKATFEALGMNDSAKVLDGAGSSNPSSSSTSSNYTSSDLYLLAKCIYAEARGESYTGQVAVGAVILNRVRSTKFPNTISGVIYQAGAFTAVSDGQINLAPDKTAMNAAQDALNGWDPTYGCLYYYNPAVATSSWIFNRKTVTTIGKHVFAI
ncbi:MAG: spore cortex-lytic enzyme [Clostridiales bacterium]|nr:spore cortex-lytic enzyme [Clostridiales bacterium]